MTVLGLLVFVRGLSLVAASGGHSSSRCGGRSSSRRAGLFTIAAPPVAGHRLQTRRLSSCGSRAQPLCGTRDPPRPGLEPVSPALAGRFSATAPPGKPCPLFLCILLILGLPFTSILGLLFASVCWISCFLDLISYCVLLCQNVFSSSCLRKIYGSLIFNHLWDLEWLNMSYSVLTLNCLFGWL